MAVSIEFKQKVKDEILAYSKMHDMSDSQFARKLRIGSAILSRLRKGEIEGLLSSNEWIRIGRDFGFGLKENNWKMARTSVYIQLEENLKFCKENGKSMIMVDDCGIGKTYCTKHIIKSMRNTFYVDCSQAKTKQAFVRRLANAVGVDNKGRYLDVKHSLKYYLNVIENPLIVLDEGGDLEHFAFLELKEIWNATDGNCAWYMLGADGLRAKVERGIRGKKVGYAEFFSRFSDEFVQLVPNGKDDKTHFYKKLLTDVASVNMTNKTKINKLVNKSLSKEATLRYLKTMINVHA